MRLQKIFSRNASFAKVLLPQTSFPLRIKPQNRRERDEWVAREANFKGLYSWQYGSNKQELFILHDGPPYANGKPHMGHVLNKLLKDFTLRYQLMLGKKVHYIPGWDCHGLPIELKALSDNAQKTPLEIRAKAKDTALTAIKEQKKVFAQLGMLANWDLTYHTMSPNYIVKQLKIFSDLFEKGLIFRDFKPVYWSPTSKTALAESELEYNDHHTSKAIYLKLALQKPYPDCLAGLPPNSCIFLVIWTTTPWTIPANQTVCYDPSSSYSLVQKGRGYTPDYFIVATSQLKRLEKIWRIEFHVLKELTGHALEGSFYKHPLSYKLLPVLPGHHVSSTVGTGFVHIAPAHGPDDFLVALEHNIPIASLVDENGNYTAESPTGLSGLNVLSDGQEKVLKLLEADILLLENYVHSYPYDWRTKTPVILRASLQWFINTRALKDDALKALSSVQVVPSSLDKSMVTQLRKRPFWCISRQRSWGVPIPVFYESCASGDKFVYHRGAVENLCKLILTDGPDVWWTRSSEEIIGESLVNNLDLRSKRLTKGMDIIDIWFDSGVSWSCVLSDSKKADIYIEGIDQFGGWFQSSLLTSVASRNEAPFKKLYAHGFVLDQHGQKMSKSLGNYIDPQSVLDGCDEFPAVGIDALRWWVATHITNNGTGIPASQSILQVAAEEVHKIRSVLRFLLGNLNGITAEMLEFRNLNELCPTDAYILHLMSEYCYKSLAAYEDMNYKKVASLTLNFVISQVSAFYLSVIKERLYCFGKNSQERLHAIYVLNEILEHTTLILAPILPHLCEEVETYHPWNSGKGGLFRNRNFSHLKDNRCVEICEVLKPALEIRDAVNKQIGSGNPKNCVVEIVVGDEDKWKNLQKFQGVECSQKSPLCELLQVSKVKLTKNLQEVVSSHEIRNPFSIAIHKSEDQQCKRCRRFVASCSDVCKFCLEAE